MAVIEDSSNIDLRVYVAENDLLSDGLPRDLAAAMVKSGEVRGLYSGFRLFIAKEAAREWLARNAPDVPLPKGLAKRKRVLKHALVRHVTLKEPSETTSAPAPTPPIEEAPMAKAASESLSPSAPSKAQAKKSPAKAAGGLKGASVAKKTAKKERPSNAVLRKLHARLGEASTPEERKAIYAECGFHPVALARWFRMLDLENIGPMKAAAAPKRKPGRPKGAKGRAKAKTLAPKAAPQKKQAAAEDSTFKVIPGLSLKAREAAIELLRALLSG